MLRKELRNSAPISVPWLPIPCRPVPYHYHNTTRTPAREAASNLALWHCGVFSSDSEKKGGSVCKDRKGRAVGPGVATKTPHCHKSSKQAAPRSKSKHHHRPRTGDQIPALREQKNGPEFPRGRLLEGTRSVRRCLLKRGNDKLHAMFFPKVGKFHVASFIIKCPSRYGLPSLCDFLRCRVSKDRLFRLFRGWLCFARFCFHSIRELILRRQILRFAFFTFETIRNDALDPLPHPASLGDARNSMDVVYL